MVVICMSCVLWNHLVYSSFTYGYECRILLSREFRTVWYVSYLCVIPEHEAHDVSVGFLVICPYANEAIMRIVVSNVFA